jgi:hypothetical protein
VLSHYLYLVAYLVVYLPLMLVCLYCISFLSSSYTLLSSLLYFIESSHYSSCLFSIKHLFWSARASLRLSIKGRSRFIALFHKEEELLYSLVLECRLLIVYYSNLFVSIVLVVVYIQLKALVKVLIHDLSLPVSLQVVCSWQLKLCINLLAELISEIRYKLRVSI